MSYHSDYHEFDFDSHHLDAMYPMTELDKQIEEDGTSVVLNKGNEPMDDIARLEYYNGNSDYIDFQCDIVGHVERGIRFALTYVVEHDSFYASINDTDDTGFDRELPDIPHDVALFMIGEEEYNKLKEIHKENEG